MDRERYNYIDLLKCIAIIFVVIYHSTNLTLNTGKLAGISSYSSYFLFSILSSCVPIFFIVNGSLLLNKPFNLKKHIYRTLNTIILAIVWGIILLIVLMPIYHQYMGLKEILESLWTLKMGWINHLWFLQALVLIYLFFPIIKTTYDNNMKSLYFFLLVVFIMTFGNILLSNCLNIFKILTGKINLHDSYNFFNLFNPFYSINAYAFVYFIFGGLMFKYKEKFNNVKLSIIIIPIAMGLLTAYGILMSKSNNGIYDIIWNGYSTIPTLIITMAIFIIAMQYKGNYKIINLIGQNSLGIYLIHMIFINLLRPYLIKNLNLGNWILNIVLALVIISASLIIVLICKKIPIIRRLFSNNIILKS